MATPSTGYSAPHIVLSHWCGQTSSWRDLPGEHNSAGAAKSAATDRGIYRVVFVCGERRLAMEPFAVVGSHPADESCTPTLGERSR